MNAAEIEEHGLVLAIQAAHMHSINYKDNGNTVITVTITIVSFIIFFYPINCKDKGITTLITITI